MKIEMEGVIVGCDSKEPGGTSPRSYMVRMRTFTPGAMVLFLTRAVELEVTREQYDVAVDNMRRGTRDVLRITIETVDQ